MYKYMNGVKDKYPFSFLTRIVSIITFFVLFIDVRNLPSKYIFHNDLILNVVFVALATIFIIALMAELKVFNLFGLRSINIVDAILCIVVSSSALYLVGVLVINRGSAYKYIVLTLINLIIVSIMIIRAIRYTKSLKKDAEYKSNIYDLRDIYEGNFDVPDNNTIMLSEKDVDYDLLQRDSVIEKLFNSILLSKPEGRFVISLEGKWGSGKTTIINNVKQKFRNINKDIVIIDEFDPWNYSDQESLFANMFDIILKKSGYMYSTQNINRTINKFSEAIFGGNKNWFFTRGFSGNNDINLLKSRINDYLRSSDKKVVFFIDNLDRIDSRNVILLFNSVANLLDFERITYVLSFDNDRVKSIFDSQLGLDYQYLKKIIQLQIRVPEMDSSILRNIYLTCMHNILKSFGEDENYLSSYELIVDNLCKHSLDIRDFKRFINSVK